MDNKIDCSMTVLRKRANKFDVPQLVKLSGLSSTLVYDLLAGKKKNPTLNTFQKLERAVRALEVSGETKKKRKPAGLTGAAK